MYDVISDTEFAKRLKEGDVLCTLAQVLVNQDLPNYNLVHAKEFMRHKYLERAEGFLELLKKNGLQITPIVDT